MFLFLSANTTHRAVPQTQCLKHMDASMREKGHIIPLSHLKNGCSYMRAQNKKCSRTWYKLVGSPTLKLLSTNPSLRFVAVTTPDDRKVTVF